MIRSVRQVYDPDRDWMITTINYPHFDVWGIEDSEFVSPEADDIDFDYYSTVIIVRWRYDVEYRNDKIADISIDPRIEMNGEIVFDEIIGDEEVGPKIITIGTGSAYDIDISDFEIEADLMIDYELGEYAYEWASRRLVLSDVIVDLNAKIVSLTFYG